MSPVTYTFLVSCPSLNIYAYDAVSIPTVSSLKPITRETAIVIKNTIAALSFDESRLDILLTPSDRIIKNEVISAIILTDRMIPSSLLKMSIRAESYSGGMDVILKDLLAYSWLIFNHPFNAVFHKSAD